MSFNIGDNVCITHFNKSINGMRMRPVNPPTQKTFCSVVTVFGWEPDVSNSNKNMMVKVRTNTPGMIIDCLVGDRYVVLFDGQLVMTYGDLLRPYLPGQEEEMEE